MYKTKLDLLGIETSIDRPILIDVVNDLKNKIGISRSIKYFLDEEDHIDRSKNKIGNIDDNSSPRSKYIVTEVVEDSTEDTDLSMFITRPDHQPIYIDNDIEASIRPIYHRRDLTITFKYFDKSKSGVNAILNKLRVLTASDGMYLTHMLEYSYSLPIYILQLIEHINTLKNLRLTTPVELEDYFNNNMDNRLDVTNFLNGDTLKSDVVIREAQSDVLGWITTDLHNIKKEYNEDTNNWSIEFEYKLTYEKPISLILMYPILVYNTLIDPGYRPINNTQPIPKKGVRSPGNKDLYELGNSSPNRLTLRPNELYLKIPKEDNLELTHQPAMMNRLFTTVTVVDVTDDTLLFNLSDLPGIGFKQQVHDFLISERVYINTMYETLFYIELYEGRHKSSNGITLDSTGLLRSTLPLDPKINYRVAFNMVNDLSILKPATKTRVKNYFLEELNISTDYIDMVHDIDKLVKEQKLNYSIEGEHVTIYNIVVDRYIETSVTLYGDYRSILNLVTDVSAITPTELTAIITRINELLTTGNYLTVIMLNQYIRKTNILDINLMSSTQATNLLNLLSTKLSTVSPKLSEQYSKLLLAVGITDVTVVTANVLKELMFKIVNLLDNLEQPITAFQYYLDTLNINTAVYSDRYEMVTGYFNITDPKYHLPKTVETTLNTAGSLRLL